MTEHRESAETTESSRGVARTESSLSARFRGHDRFAIGAFALAIAGGIAVFVVASELFPYHSLNHDEAVYLQQAAMLLDGQLVLRPPVVEAFRPWFFVDGGEYLYPKYAPVPAAVFALGLGIGVPRLSLALVASAILLCTYLVLAEAFSRRVGLVAAAFVLASPLFLLNSAVFLPYAPTTALNLAFAATFLRADRITDRRRSLKYAALAGVAIALSVFARPYTALLFAAPFVAYALWTLRDGSRDALAQWGVVALFGLLGIALTLAYNAALTGAPLRFPYEVFAPRDGLGFGTREILGHVVAYTPTLALEANVRVLGALVTEWIAGGRLGGVLALLGLFVLAVRSVRRNTIAPRQAAVLAVLVSVSAGNFYFWGNLNVLGALSVPDDGLIHYLGPYYHFDLLVPVSALAAIGALWCFDRLRRLFRTRLAPTRARLSVALVACVLCAGVVAGSITAGAPHVRANAAVTDHYEQAYAPFESREFDDALVFVPEPYGPWLNHPFQPLRNDPGYDGNVVYALEKRPFAVVDAFPDRTLYRYSYRGGWAPVAGPAVIPRLERIEAVTGEQVTLRADLGVPAEADRVSIRLATDEGHAYYAVRGTPGTLSLETVVGDGAARLLGPVTSVGNAAVPVGERDDLTITVFVDYGTGTGFSYDLTLPVAREDGRTRALSSAVELCRVPLHCGGGAAYVPSETRPGVAVETTLEADVSAPEHANGADRPEALDRRSLGLDMGVTP